MFCHLIECLWKVILALAITLAIECVVYSAAKVKLGLLAEFLLYVLCRHLVFK